MTLDELLESLEALEPPRGLGPAPLALWRDTKGDWAEAHRCVTAEEGEASMRVHAYLHRKEGDLADARYWYARAGRAPASGPLDEEWTDIAIALHRPPDEG